jgi:hypothetical protein
MKGIGARQVQVFNENMMRPRSQPGSSTMSKLTKKTPNEATTTPTPFIVKEPTTFQKSFTKTYKLFGEEKRRDAIIALIQHQHRSEPFVVPFVAHLMNIDPYKLDGYGKLEFKLLEFGIELTFLTWGPDESEMSYPIANLSDEPDHRLKRSRTFMEWIRGTKI